jgi:hypothetical protein
LKHQAEWLGFERPEGIIKARISASALIEIEAEKLVWK